MGACHERCPALIVGTHRPHSCKGEDGVYHLVHLPVVTRVADQVGYGRTKRLANVICGHEGLPMCVHTGPLGLY